MSLLIKRSTFLKAGLFLLFAVTCFTGLQQKASAGINEMPAQLPTRNSNNVSVPDTHQYINITNSNTNYDGGYGAKLTASSLKTYDTADRTQNFSLYLVDRNAPTDDACLNFDISIYAYKLNTTGSPVGLHSKKTLIINGCQRNYNFSIDPGWLTGSSLPGHNGMFVGILYVVLEPYPGVLSTGTFQLKNSTGRLGYWGYSGNQSHYSVIYPSQSGSSSGDTGDSSDPAVHRIEQKFGVPCNYGGPGTVRIYFKDDDQPDLNPSTFGPQRGRMMKVSVDRFGPNGFYLGNGSFSNLTWLTEGNTDSNKFGYMDLNIQAGYKYKINFDDVTGGNGIALYYPFDSGDFNIQCPGTGGASDVGCSRVQFTVPNDGKTHRYRVYVNDWGSPGTPADSNGDGDPYNDNVDYGGTVGSGGTATFNLEADNKVVSGTLTTTVVIYNHDLVASGIYSQNTQNKGPCYTASCNIDIVENVPGAPSNTGDVKGGERFGVWVQVNNTGINDLPANLSGNGTLSATMAIDGKWGPAPDNQSSGNLAPASMATIPRGNSGVRYFELNAPNDINIHDLNMYPDYWGRGGIGGWCTGKVNTHKRYDFVVTANSSLNDSEAPTNVAFATTVRQGGGVDVDGTTTRAYFKRPAGGARAPIPGYNGTDKANPHSRNFGDENYNDNYGVPQGTYTLGDAWCVAITLDRGHGWKGPNGRYYNEGPAYDDNCDPGGAPPVQNNPYVRAYGGDVVAGGGFGSSCGWSDSKILTFLRPLSEHTPGGRSGSGSQLAAMALGVIGGFTSASMRHNVPPVEPRGLTFANTSPDSGSVNNTIINPVLGGNMSGNGWCVPDYFSSTQFVNNIPTGSTAPINAQSLTPDEGQTVRNLNGGKLRLTASGVANYQRRHAVYVDGDVFIANNIMYRADYSGDTKRIPSFTLVVKGNIFISKDVTELDGLYIAQPSPSRPGTGRIYTCATDAGDVPITSSAGMFNDCGAATTINSCSPTALQARRLTVNGAFIAQRVVLNRTGYSIRCSQYNEGAAASKAAEVFNFSPEIYLSPPVFRPKGTASSGDYDYISILAPIL